MKKNWKRVLTTIVVIIVAFAMGIFTASAAGRWKGTDVVINTNKNLDKIETAILNCADSQDEIDRLKELINNRDNLIEELKKDVEDAIDLFEKTNSNLINHKDIVEQERSIVEELKAENELLKQKLSEVSLAEDYAYEDVVKLDGRVEAILERINTEK